MPADLHFLPKEMVDELRRGVDGLECADCGARIVSHYDADGLAAAGILSLALGRRGLPFQTTILKGLSRESVDDLKEEEAKIIIFADMGCGNIDDIEELDSRCIVLDHHVPRRTSEKVLQINPHFHEMDGAIEISGSTMAFLFALAMDKNNWDLVPISLAGSIGDKQHYGGFKGVNSVILAEALEKGLVEKRPALLLDGDTVLDAIASSFDPFFVGLSGDEGGTLAFLDGLGLDPEAAINDLAPEKTRHLSSALALRLLSQGAREENVENLYGDLYWAPDWNIHVQQVAMYANACGRMDDTGTGVTICMGDKEAIAEGKKVHLEHVQRLCAEMAKVMSDGLHPMDNLQFFYNDSSELSGTLAGTGMLYFFDQSKPTFGIAAEGETARVSTRGTAYLVSKGLDLSAVCRVTAESVGGQGGGHPVASGASFPKGKEDAFLKMADEMIGEQLAPKDDEEK